MSQIKTRRLPCQLTSDEINERATRNANAVAELRSIEGEKKCANTVFKAKIDEKKSEIYELTEAVTSGIEFRSVSVYDQIDRVKGICETIRSDTGEVVETRRLTPHELQMTLDDLSHN